MPEDQLETSPLSSDFTELRKKIYHSSGGKFYIGGVEMAENVRAVLRDQARYVQTSQLWEILEATIINESSNLALIQSKEWDHVLSAKQLHHWMHVFKNMIHALAQE